jgi:hypothetical protein
MAHVTPPPPHDLLLFSQFRILFMFSLIHCRKNCQCRKYQTTKASKVVTALNEAPNHESTWGNGTIYLTIFSSALSESERLTSGSDHFNQGERGHGIHWTWGRMASRGNSDTLEMTKLSCPAGSGTPIRQSSSLNHLSYPRILPMKVQPN